MRGPVAKSKLSTSDITYTWVGIWNPYEMLYVDSHCMPLFTPLPHTTWPSPHPFTQYTYSYFMFFPGNGTKPFNSLRQNGTPVRKCIPKYGQVNLYIYVQKYKEDLWLEHAILVDMAMSRQLILAVEVVADYDHRSYSSLMNLCTLPSLDINGVCSLKIRKT